MMMQMLAVAVAAVVVAVAIGARADAGGGGDAQRWVSQQARGSLKGETVLITGASSGIGAAVALHLAVYAQANVVLTARRKAKLDKLVGDIAAAGGGGGKALAVACDVTSSEQVEAAFAAGVAQFGSIEHVFANAGYEGKTASGYDDLADAQRIFDINYFGVRRTMVSALKEFKRNGGKKTTTFVINSSVAGLLRGAHFAAVAHVRPSQSADMMWDYSASKAALDALVRGGVVFAAQGTRVFGVSPFVYESEMVLRIGSEATLEGMEAFAGFNLFFPGMPGRSEDFGPVLQRLFAADAPLATGTSLIFDGDLAFPQDAFHNLLTSSSADFATPVNPSTLRNLDLEPLHYTAAQLAAHQARYSAVYKRERAARLAALKAKKEL